MKTKIYVLIACEESQTECLAFRQAGAAAFSCDLQKCSGGHNEWHIRQDVSPFLKGQRYFILAFWLFGRCSVVMVVLRKVDAVGGRGLRPYAAPPRVAGCACRCASDTAHNALPAPFGRSARGRAPLMRCPPLRGGLVCRLPPCATLSWWQACPAGWKACPPCPKA